VIILKIMNTIMIAFFCVITSISTTVMMMAEPQNIIQPPSKEKKVCRGDINKEGVVCTSWDTTLPNYYP